MTARALSIMVGHDALTDEDHAVLRIRSEGLALALRRLDRAQRGQTS